MSTKGQSKIKFSAVLHQARSCTVSHLKIVFPVDDEPVAEHVPHDDEVGVLALHAHAVHAKELRKERVAVTLDYMLQERRGEKP